MRARELIRFGNDVRVWQEDESPYQRIAEILKDRGLRTRRVGLEERLRFFVYDGIRKEASGVDFVSADPVTAGCRMTKSATEIALLQHANDVTIAAIKAAFATLREGMTQYDLGNNVSSAYRALGYSGGALVGLGKYSAFPHGSIQPQQLHEGDIVLVDTGCSVDGYQSDITRTTVFGKPSARQIEIWNLERKAQDAAFAAAKVGATCESVDAAARKVIVDAGFGPGYKVPGLPHRTGHGIGLDGHEWTNFVKGNTRTTTSSVYVWRIACTSPRVAPTCSPPRVRRSISPSDNLAQRRQDAKYAAQIVAALCGFAALRLCAFARNSIGHCAFFPGAGSVSRPSAIRAARAISGWTSFASLFSSGSVTREPSFVAGRNVRRS